MEWHTLKHSMPKFMQTPHWLTAGSVIASSNGEGTEAATLLVMILYSLFGTGKRALYVNDKERDLARAQCVNSFKTLRRS